MPMDQPDNLVEPSAAAEAGERVSPMKTMPLGEHLEELRRHLLLGLAGVGVGLVVAVTFSFEIIAWLQTPLIEAQHALGYTPQTVATDATFGFMTVYVPVSLIAALVIAAPWVVYQLWRFVESGLYEHEKKAAHLLAPLSAVMTVGAVLFARYVLLPVCIVFFLKFAALYPEMQPRQPGAMISLLTRGESAGGDAGGAGGEISEPSGGASEAAPVRVPVLEGDPVDPRPGDLWIDAGDGRVKLMLHGDVRVLAVTSSRLLSPLPDLPKQVKFAAMLGLGVVIGFHLPVLMLVVGWTGLVDPAMVAKQRKYAVFGCFALGAVLTPADLMSMFVLGVPMYGLFELGLVLMRWADRDRNSEPEHP